MQEVKWLSEETLQIGEEREAIGKGERKIYTQLNVEFQRIARRDKNDGVVTHLEVDIWSVKSSGP